MFASLNDHLATFTWEWDYLPCIQGYQKLCLMSQLAAHPGLYSQSLRGLGDNCQLAIWIPSTGKMYATAAGVPELPGSFACLSQAQSAARLYHGQPST